MRHVEIRMTPDQWLEWVSIDGTVEAATASLRSVLTALPSHERVVAYKNYSLYTPAELAEE